MDRLHRKKARQLPRGERHSPAQAAAAKVETSLSALADAAALFGGAPDSGRVVDLFEADVVAIETQGGTALLGEEKIHGRKVLFLRRQAHVDVVFAVSQE